MSKFITDELDRKKARLTFTLALISMLFMSFLIILSRSTPVRGVAINAYGAQDPWLNENWAKRAPIIINNSNNSNTLYNYQLQVVVSYDNDMKPNFGDLRFCDSDGVTELSYWIENYNENENALVWVKVPSIPASDNSTIYMYYGNPNAETKSDAQAVFEFFDNFDGSTEFSTVAYPYGDPNIALPEDTNFVEFGNNGGEEYIKLGSYDEGELRENLNLPFSSYGIVVEWRTANDTFWYDSADYTNYDDKYGASTITPKRLIVVNENKIYEKDNRLLSYSERTEVGYTGAIDNLYLAFGSSGGGGTNPYYTYYNLAFIRKLAEPEPITSVGEEESNTAPTAPSLLEPENNSCENDSTPLFGWGTSTDPEGDPIIYTLQVDNEANFAAPFVYNNNLITENQQELPAENVLSDGVYYWRVGARDALNPDNWSESFTFTIDTFPPSVPSLQSPLDGTITNDNTPTFTWTAVIDPSGVTYDLQADNDPDFSSPEINQTGLAYNLYTSTAELVDENYSWRVRAIDGAGNVGDWSAAWTLLVDTVPPSMPSLVLPENGALLGTPDVSFSWAEPEPGVDYYIQIDNEASFNPPYVNENQSILDNSYFYTFARAGNYYWRISATDEAGNWSGWGDNFKLTIEVAVWPGTPHNPIKIENDDFFNSDNGVVAGSGSEGDPYIIENWVINAQNANGIEIRNTTAHFVVRNCTSENGGLNNFGIYLENLANGWIENCTTENNIYGIYLSNSLNNNVNNNISSNNQHGIYLSFSSNNTISNNYSSNNIWYGIALYPYSSNNTLENNTSKNNLVGIYLQQGSYNNMVSRNTTMQNAYGIRLYLVDNTTLDNNACSINFRGIYSDSSNGIKMSNNALFNNQYNFGVVGTVLSHFVHEIDPSNLVNGKPIRYLVDNKNEVIDPQLDTGYLALVNCDNIRVENLTLGNNEQGLLMVSTSGSLIDNCTFENNYWGASLYSSANNRIFHNNFLNNGTQARDDGSNSWDNGYPSGGNYWSDYTGSDIYRGENRDILGDDGIGDTPYYVSGGNTADRDPFINVWPQAASVEVSISPSYQVAPIDATITYLVSVKNIGISNSTYLLVSTENNGWNLAFDDNLLENLELGENRATMLTVTVPDNDNVIGVEDNITVTATLLSDNSVENSSSCTAYATSKNASGVSLVTGWNLRVFTPINENMTPNNLFTGLEYYTDYYIYYWNAPGGPYTVQDPDTVLKDNVGYWVWIKQDKTVIVSGNLPDNSDLYLVAGWNLLGFPITDENTTPNNIFTGLEYYTDYYLYYWTAPGGPYNIQDPDTTLKENTGYWVWIDTDRTITIP